MNILRPCTASPADVHALRQAWADLAARPDWRLLQRHDLLADKPPKGVVNRAWRVFRRGLAACRLVSPRVTAYAWSPELKHAPASASGARTLVILAMGLEREALRAACAGFQRQLTGQTAWVPVLITDVADFAWFSRLGWLVEFVPELPGDGPDYAARKLRHLAWLYREAVLVPAASGLEPLDAQGVTFG